MAKITLYIKAFDIIIMCIAFTPIDHLVVYIYDTACYFIIANVVIQKKHAMFILLEDLLLQICPIFGNIVLYM